MPLMRHQQRMKIAGGRVVSRVNDLRSAGNSTWRSEEAKLGARTGRSRQPSASQDGELKADQFRPARALVRILRGAPE